MRRLLVSLLPRRWVLNAKLHRINRIYRKLVADAEKKLTPDELQELQVEWYSESEPIEEELRSIFADKLVKKANRLKVPIPPKCITGRDEVNGNWQRGTFTGLWYLTSEGLSKLRSSIRAERRERRDAAAFWIAVLTGLIGALTGLIAVWRR